MSWRRIVLLAVFCPLALSKALTPYDTKYLISPTAYYAALSVEVFIIALTVVGRVRAAALLGCLFFGIAMIYAALALEGECGCLGRVSALSRRVRFVVAGGLGTLCAVMLWLEARRSISPQSRGIRNSAEPVRD